eukprot:jgi/Botrbrau1/6818/Bobra.0153s0015.3
MAVFWIVCLPPFLLTLGFVALLLLYTSRIFIKKPNIGKLAESTKSRSSKETDDLEVQRSSDVELQFVPKPLAWDGICLTVKAGEKVHKHILKGCSGVVFPGEMMAIVGPSGAGKSTLLDILAMRVKPSSGRIIVDCKVQDSEFKRFSTYVPQEDSFIPTLTVWETLGLVSRLRLPRSLSTAQRRQIMSDILESMGLHKVKHSQVGGLLPGGLYVRGLSGGERRRLNISCGIVAAPSIIFLDEPTSGLDSHAALVLMDYMQKLAKDKRTIICSIHQPRQAIWELFTKVEVLSEGFLMYTGPTEGAVTWFGDKLNYKYNPSQDGTPCDWLLDLISVSFAGGSHHSPGMTDIGEVQIASDRFCKEALVEIITDEAFILRADETVGPSGLHGRCVTCGTNAVKAATTVPVYPTSFWNQLMCLLWRSLMSYLRNPADVIGRLLMSLSIGIVVGVTFINSNNGEPWNHRLRRQITVMCKG